MCVCLSLAILLNTMVSSSIHFPENDIISLNVFLNLEEPKAFTLKWQGRRCNSHCKGPLYNLPPFSPILTALQLCQEPELPGTKQPSPLLLNERLDLAWASEILTGTGGSSSLGWGKLHLYLKLSIPINHAHRQQSTPVLVAPVNLPLIWSQVISIKYYSC